MAGRPLPLCSAVLRVAVLTAPLDPPAESRGRHRHTQQQRPLFLACTTRIRIHIHDSFAHPVTIVLVALSAARFLARWSKSVDSEQFERIELSKEMSSIIEASAIRCKPSMSTS